MNKKEIKNKYDLFEFLLDFWNKNKNYINIGSLVFLSLILILMIYNNIDKSNKETAARIFDTSLAYINNLQYITNTDDRMKVFQEQINNLNALIQQFPRTVPAVRARLLLGRIFFNEAYQSQKEEYLNLALSYYSAAYEAATSDFYKVLALIGKAACYEQKNDFHRANEQYELILNKYPNQGFSPLALIGKARAQEMLGDINKCLDLYKQVVINYPDSEWSKFASGKLYYYGESTKQKSVHENIKPLQLPEIK